MSQKTDVLVAEDDMGQLQGLSAILRHAGFEVHAADSGPDAIRMGLREKPEAIICDWNLGVGPDGAEVVRRLKSDNPGLLAIFITGNDVGSLQAATRDMTDVWYFAKPVSPQRLVDTLNAAVSGCGMHDGDEPRPRW